MNDTLADHDIFLHEDCDKDNEYDTYPRPTDLICIIL